MDATLSQLIPLERTQMIPQSTDEFSFAWGRRVAEQQVRSLGYRGSYGTFLNGQYNPSNVYEANSDIITLPILFWGTNYPPIILAYAQWGTSVFIDSFVDEARAFASPPTGNSANKPPSMRTWVEVTRRGHAVFGSYWTFQIKHRIGMPDVRGEFTLGGPVRYKPPYEQMKHMEFPWDPAIAGLVPITVTGTQLVLHWVALGLDPNF